eukprot:GCRY01000790.1.p1 GENE.GCRY01000790.1~~GCRY01000790.1.p1  ORF type:complete len:107 (+),score=18.31 GCRY01000790.1:234-554(+)
MSKTTSQAIPVQKNNSLQIPEIDQLAQTPGGSRFFATTPGGSKIFYSRDQLVKLSRSPLSRTPPANMPFIAGVTFKNPEPEQKVQVPVSEPEKPAHHDDDTMFSME